MNIIKEFRWLMLRFTMPILCIAILALLIPAGSFAEQSCRCLQKNVVGTYAGAFEGTLMVTLEDGTKMPVRNAALGVMTIDREGIMSQHGYLVVGNQIMRFGIEPEDPPFTGKITVNPDCTGKVELSRGEVFEAIVQDGGDEIILLETVSPSGAPTFTGRAKRISWIPDIYRANGGRPNRAVGTYTNRSSGVNMNPDLGPLPSALLGLSSTGPDGTVSFRGTKVVAGTPIPITFADGEWKEGELPFTRTVTASIMSGDTDLGEYEGWFVELEGGNELWSISLYEAVGSPVVLGTSKRISILPTDLE